LGQARDSQPTHSDSTSPVFFLCGTATSVARHLLPLSRPVPATRSPSTATPHVEPRGHRPDPQPGPPLHSSPQSRPSCPFKAHRSPPPAHFPRHVFPSPHTRMTPSVPPPCISSNAGAGESSSRWIENCVAFSTASMVVRGREIGWGPADRSADVL
jgi:hypothetical protein